MLHFMTGIGSSGLREIVLSSLQLILTFIQFVLHCWSDHSDSETAQKSPEDMASSFSKLFLFWQGYKEPLTVDKLPPIPARLSTDVNTHLVMNKWNGGQKHRNVLFVKHRNDSSSKENKKQIGILTALIKSFGLEYFLWSILALIHTLSLFASQQNLRLLISFMKDEDQPMCKGYVYALSMFAVMVIGSVTNNQYKRVVFDIGFRARNSVVSMIYRKSLKLSSTARQKYTVGEITNYVSVDTQRILSDFEFVGILNF